jgi:hypothetical protein
MLPTTIEALKAMVKADPTVTPVDRQRIVEAVRNHGRLPETRQAPVVSEKCIWSRREVARRFNRSLRFVDHLAKAGTLRRVRLPGRQRACGFVAAEVERLMAAEEVA